MIAPRRHVVATCLTVLTLASASRVAATARCLTPDTSRVLDDVLATGTVQRRLPGGFTIENVEIGGQAIALGVLDPQRVRYEVTLRVAPTGEARGRKFTVVVGDAPNPPPPEVRGALLAAARVVDDAIPDSVLADCSGSAGDPGGRAAGPEAPRAPTVPPALALASAVAEVLVVVAAVLFSLAVIARRPSTDGRG